MTQQQRREFESWKAVVAKLIDLGAVTPSDGRAPVGSTGTEGQRLYTLIREWGEARAEMTVDSQSTRKERTVNDLHYRP